MKKALVILLALALVFGLVLTACDIGGGGGGGGKKPSPGPEPELGLPEVVIDGADIVLYAIGNKQPTIDGNKVKYLGVDAGVTGSGFAYDFPADVKGKGYWKINVEMEVISIANPDFISFNAKDSTTMGTDVLIFGHTQQYHNELKLGTIVDKEISAACSADCLEYTAGTCVVGAKNSADYPFNKFTNDMIAFQYNPWAGDITTPGWGSGDGKPEFEIAITKITFIPAEGEIVKLSAPVIALDGTTGIKWEAVTGATGYNVLADGTAVGSKLDADATSVDLLSMPALAIRPEPYSITLVAVGNPGISNDSDPSNAVSFDKSAAPPLYNVPAGGIDLGAITVDDNPYWEADTSDVTTKNYLYVVFDQKPSGSGNFVWQDATDKSSGYNGWHNAGQSILGSDGTPNATYASLTGDDKILKIDLTAILGSDTPATYMKLVFQYYGGGEVLGGYLAD
jgi:hypothetical protein